MSTSPSPNPSARPEAGAAGQEPYVVAEWFSLEQASWLNDDTLLLFGRAASPGAGPVSAWAADGAPVDVRMLELSGSGGMLLLLRLAAPRDGFAPGLVELHREGGAAEIDQGEVAGVAVELATLVLESLSELAAADRSAVMAFLASAAGDAALRTPSLGRKLGTVREALRERFPSPPISRDEPVCFNAEMMLAVDPRTFYLKGWIWDRDHRATRVCVVSPEGGTVDITHRVFRHDRPDLDKLFGAEQCRARRPGFIACFELDAPSVETRGWLLQVTVAGGMTYEGVVPEAGTDTNFIRDCILNDFALDQGDGRVLVRDHGHPALQQLQERRARASGVASVEQFGRPVRDAMVSVVVSLYQRLDFLEHQLVQFGRDAAMRSVDLIYVLDSPEQAAELHSLASSLAALHDVSFRVAVLRHNSGFAVASNLGAGLAAGRLLVLMNSDVLPGVPGWLPRMAAFHDSRPGIGALAPKLLYEDDSIQHAGIRFERRPAAGVWDSEYDFKGLHRTFPAATVPRVAPAVSAACLMIDRGLFLRLGGLRGSYLHGDLEDTDLCLRLAGAGLENWYLPGVELYHLEGQSSPGQLRERCAEYNAWLRTELCGAILDRLSSPHCS